MSARFASVDDLFGALAASRDADDEGGLPILEHSLQCAALLRVARPLDVELQVAGLVHDLGWLERGTAGWTLRLDAAHDVEGRALVEGLLGPRVASLVGGHVAAKRYLLATDPRYRARALGPQRDDARVPGRGDDRRGGRAVRRVARLRRSRRAPPGRRRGQGAGRGRARSRDVARDRRAGCRGRTVAAFVPRRRLSRGSSRRRRWAGERPPAQSSARPLARGRPTPRSVAMVGAQSAAPTRVVATAPASGSTSG